jgi:hypothetical protein
MTPLEQLLQDAAAAPKPSPQDRIGGPADRGGLCVCRVPNLFHFNGRGEFIGCANAAAVEVAASAGRVRQVEGERHAG